MTLSTEAEIGVLYINAREAIPARHMLEEIGHPQPPTPMQKDNSMALGVVTNTIQPKQTKAMDMLESKLKLLTLRQHDTIYSVNYRSPGWELNPGF